MLNRADSATPYSRFDIGTGGQQVHVSHPNNASELLPSTSRQHPCFKIDNVQDLIALQERIWKHHERGGDSAPVTADKVGGENSGQYLVVKLPPFQI